MHRRPLSTSRVRTEIEARNFPPPFIKEFVSNSTLPLQRSQFLPGGIRRRDSFLISSEAATYRENLPALRYHASGVLAGFRQGRTAPKSTVVIKIKNWSESPRCSLRPIWRQCVYPDFPKRNTFAIATQDEVYSFRHTGIIPKEHAPPRFHQEVCGEAFGAFFANLAEAIDCV